MIDNQDISVNRGFYLLAPALNYILFPLGFCFRQRFPGCRILGFRFFIFFFGGSVFCHQPFLPVKTVGSLRHQRLGAPHIAVGLLYL